MSNAKAKPNIVFFFTDDQRFDTIAALNNPGIITPNIDRLVERGVTFTHAHIPGGTCPAVCMPSRAMLHTGRTLFHLDGFSGAEIPGEQITLGETLRKNGYRSWGTGKWHNGFSAFNRSFDDGAEIMFGGMGDHWNVPVFSYDPTGCYKPELPYIADPSRTRDVSFHNGDHIAAGKHSSELFCDAAVEYLDKRRDETPFFMYISFMAPHDPRSMPEKYLKMYDPKKIILPENYLSEHPFDYGISQMREEVLASFPRREDETQEHIAEYYAMITHLDAEMGKVIKKLEETGRLDNTIIVFAGDNGLALGQHGLFGKQSAYDHSVRVPLIMAGPGLPAGEQRDQLCYLLDVYPTLCDLVDAPIPQSVEGMSLKPVIDEKTSEHRDCLYFAHYHHLRGCRHGDYKLIEYATADKRRTQLFNLKTDPWEINNLAPVDTEKVKAMRQNLHELRDEWDDLKHVTGRQFWSRY